MTEWLGQVPAPVVYAVVAGAVLAESGMLIGAVIPTLTLLLTAGALARGDQLNLVLLIAVTAVAAVAGDAVGHRTGRLLGPRLRAARLGRKIPVKAWQRAGAVMSRGGVAVFFARFTPVLRTLIPHLAGATGVPYLTIAPYSAAAAILWAGAEASVGYAAAAWFARVVAWGGPALAAAALIVAGAVLLIRTATHRPAMLPAGSQ